MEDIKMCKLVVFINEEEESNWIYVAYDEADAEEQIDNVTSSDSGVVVMPDGKYSGHVTDNCIPKRAKKFPLGIEYSLLLYVEKGFMDNIPLFKKLVIDDIYGDIDMVNLKYMAQSFNIIPYGCDDEIVPKRDTLCKLLESEVRSANKRSLVEAVNEGELFKYFTEDFVKSGVHEIY